MFSKVRSIASTTNASKREATMTITAEWDNWLIEGHVTF